jgi:hypothetical protein
MTFVSRTVVRVASMITSLRQGERLRIAVAGHGQVPLRKAANGYHFPNAPTRAAIDGVLVQTPE